MPLFRCFSFIYNPSKGEIHSKDLFCFYG